MPYKVSLYVPCYNGEKSLGSCLITIFNQTYPIAEVLIVDDGSTDKSLDIASQFEVKVLKHESNRGITAARNTALENSQGEFIASVDADVQLDKFWLERIMENFSRPEVGGVGGRITEINTESLVRKWILSHRNPDKGEKRIDNVECLPGTSVVYRKRALLEIGGFNDDKRYDHSDLDASMRMKAFAYNLVYEPRALCYHHFSGGLLSLFDGHWRFKKDAYINLGLFKNIHGLKRKIRFNLGRFLQAMMDDIDDQNFSILYLNLLGALRYTLMDAKLYHEIHKRSGNGDFSQTYTALIAGIRYLFEKKDDIPDSLRQRVFDHIKDLRLALLNKRYKMDRVVKGKSYLTGLDGQDGNFRDIKLREIFPASLDDGDALAENIHKYLPEADLNFISECLSALSGFLSYFDSSAWDRISESAEMVVNEAS